MPRLISALGLLVMMLLAWLMSSNRRVIPWRVVGGGLVLQLTLGLMLLRTPGDGTSRGGPLDALGRGFNHLMDHVDAGAGFVFGPRFNEFPFAFKVLPAVIFFSALMSVLYYVGFMQFLVRGMGWIMQRVMGTSGAESLSAAANVFAGQTEAPLVVRPYLERMTDSELMAIMVGGYANIAGGVLAAYVSMGIDAGHLLTASFISAPASLLIAKLMQPETGVPATRGGAKVEFEQTSVNVLDAVVTGANDGLKLALNIAAMLIAFLAIISLVDLLIDGVGGWFGQEWSLAYFLGYAFAPFAWLMGVDPPDVLKIGELVGLRMASNEFIAYEKLAAWMQPDSGVQLTERSRIIATYALCGFANLGSVGVQIGGLSALVPSRRPDLARLAFRAMLGGTLSTFMTACIAGMLL